MKSTLTQKGLILVLVPLLFQFLFFLLVLSAMRQAAEAQMLAYQSKEVSVRLQEVRATLLMAESSMQIFQLTGKEQFRTAFREAAAASLRQLNYLAESVRDNQELVENVQELRQLIEAELAWHRETERLTLDQIDQRARERLGSDERQRMIETLRTAVEEFAGEMENLDASRLEGYRAARVRLGWLFVVGGVVAVTLTLGLAFGYSRGIRQRLQVVADNAGRLARDEPLLPAIGGQDEIAAVDHSFHRMAGELAATRESLQQQMQLLRSVLDSMSDAVTLASLDGRLLLTNPAVERIFGPVSPDEQPANWSRRYGLHQPDQRTLIPPEDLPMSRVLRGETVDEQEMFVRPRAGDRGVLVQASGRPIRDREGRITAGVVVCRDVTERRQAEDQSRTAAERIRELYDKAPCGYHSLDSEGVFQAINQTELDWLGYSAEDVVGRLRFSDLLTNEGLALFAREFPEFQKRGWVRGLEFELRRADGQLLPVTLDSRALYDEQGRFVASNSTVIDLSERQRAEQKFRDLLESAPDAMVIVNAQGVITLVNAQAERLFGRPRAEMLARPIELLIPERFHPQHPGLRTAYCVDPHPRVMGAGLDLFARHGAGHEIPVEISLAPLATPEGLLVSAAIRDVTERKNIELRIRRLNEELEERVRERTAELATANRELGDKNRENEMFVYSVSHDLRSPLVNLQGFSKELAAVASDLRALLNDPTAPPELRNRCLTLVEGDMAEAIRFIQTAVARLSGIIDALLRLSRAGRVVIQPQELDMTQLAEKVVTALHDTIVARKVNLVIQELPTIVADPSTAERVLANLIENAIKYLDPNRPGEVVVGAQARVADQASPIFFVRDNGVGIPEPFRPRVFQGLHRGHPHLAPGEGIGLAIVRRIVERHGGRVWFESTVDVGTTFFFTLASDAANLEPEG